MPVKRPNDVWAAAPDAPAYPRTRSDGAKSHLKPVLSGLAVLTTVAAAVAVFIALSQPPGHAVVAANPSGNSPLNASAQPAVAPSRALPVSALSIQSASETTVEAPTLPAATASGVAQPVGGTTVVPIAVQPAPVQAASSLVASSSGPAAATPGAPVTAASVAPTAIAVPISTGAPASVPTSATVPAALMATSADGNPVAPAPEQAGIRNTHVVIAGHLYECYGQQAHLACDLQH